MILEDFNDQIVLNLTKGIFSGLIMLSLLIFVSYGPG